MAEEGKRVGGLSSGLAVLLNGQDRKENSLKTRLVSSFDDFGNQPMERALEYIFGLSNEKPFTGPVDTKLVRSILKNEYSKFCIKSGHLVYNRYEIHINKDGCESQVVGLEELSICGDIRIKHPLHVESLAMFSSARSNACVWKGKWLYEVLLETSGAQQLGWATLSCPFTDLNGVGDGKRVRKWNNDVEPYGQPWVVGDVIGCCTNPNDDEILFYRNGVSLRVAFHGICKMGPGSEYYPTISLSQGERCELNFGLVPSGTPFRGFFPFQHLLPQIFWLCNYSNAYQGC
ncbi:RING FINGER AND SRY DOMAIN-CONTAINING [Salix koriyanagi]|uniref:RING FINGER AND SRY DOMAIN-CONTAINING n=1 Tax=Salix koriyanagi TaxID=2511006 RepID=A0A9Q0ZGB5_9ROSI|nr:RING FINGER AND SRY DOMAIN-CONTAINING [Salix koriyanagi]